VGNANTHSVTFVKVCISKLHKTKNIITFNLLKNLNWRQGCIFYVTTHFSIFFLVQHFSIFLPMSKRKCLRAKHNCVKKINRFHKIPKKMVQFQVKLKAKLNLNLMLFPLMIGLIFNIEISSIEIQQNCLIWISS
jgi:hypothetical protein